MSKASVALAVTLLGSIYLTACSPADNTGHGESSATSGVTYTGEAGKPIAHDPNPFTCQANPGVAPSGELTAERLYVANRFDKNSLYEGPVWKDGALYFSHFTLNNDFPSRILRLMNDDSIDVVIDVSGSNGLALDQHNYLLGASHKEKGLVRYDLQSQAVTKLTDKFEGSAFNSPNDLTVAKDGTIYFTDPDFQVAAAPGSQPKTRVYRLAPDGVLTVIDDTIANPNGISFSPDQKTLYVAGGGEQGFLRAYSLEKGANSSHHDLVSDLQVPDGMAIDCLGNIYVTEHLNQRVRVFSAEGTAIASIQLDANVTNAAFGGEERKTLYLTGAESIWKVDLDVSGFPY